MAETSPEPRLSRYAALEKICYGCIVFLSAFLLFQVQPIIAKMILPWFGGSSAVWNTCMLFFQGALLAGYLYAHWLHSRLSRFRQAAVHTVLLAVSLAALPIIPNVAWRPAGATSPSWHILALLMMTIGLPYFLLSTTSPLMQAWYARSHSGGTTPYRLFAVSNFASMLALLSYPPVVEPNLTTHSQAVLWSAAYACFVVLCGSMAVAQAFAPVSATGTDASATDTENASLPVRVLWAALAACASILLLSITTYLTQDVAPIPFLWIVPLSVYLLSFIICFEAPRLYWRPIFLPLLPIALGITTYRLWKGAWGWSIIPTIAVMVASLFIVSMVCHGELASLKPHPRHLTGFYLMVALGGAAGGLFVAVIAPNVFHAYHEFPIALGLAAALAIAAQWARRPARPAILHNRAVQGFLAAALAGYFVCLFFVSQKDLKGARAIGRNFYGRLTVEDEKGVTEDQAVRKLLHGVIDHGHQPLEAELSRQPSSYFCPESGVGLAMHAKSRAPRRVGILGLGCGTLLAYGRAGDVFQVYEINPLVVRLARTEFTYWKDSRASVQLIMGDGRLSLEREPSQQFDLLVMDAFSGDSVPVHLITTEAFRTYFRHLKPDGILAVNISNRYLDLKPVMERAATALGKVAMAFEYYADEDENYLCYDCTWALILDPAVRSRFPNLGGGVVLPPYPAFRAWTDDFSDMRRILR